MFGTVRSGIFQVITKKEDTKNHLGQKCHADFCKGIRKSKILRKLIAYTHKHTETHTHKHTHTLTHTHTYTHAHPQPLNDKT